MDSSREILWIAVKEGEVKEDQRDLLRYCGVCEELWLERPIGMKDGILFIVFDLNSDLWLEGRLKVIGIFYLGLV
jgi:hypothetical protein